MSLSKSLALGSLQSIPPHAQNSTGQPEIVQGTLKIYGNDSYPVYFRRALPVDAPRARYPGFNPSSQVLKAGSIRREGAKPLTSDIVFERDVPMTLRDGTTIYTDIYRPIANDTVPAIVAWSPYGKEVGGSWLDDIANRSSVPLSSVSELQKFEGPDPAYWVAEGYAIVNPDTRGAYSSHGNITLWGRQLAEDGYDFIEWVASQPWSSGKVGMSGNSWLAVSQWFIAAENPPHLTAIAPWEGLTDLFRHVSNRGGIASPAFEEAIITTLAGYSFVEDQPRMAISQPLMNQYWEDKIAQLSKITVPAYIVASYTNDLHTQGSFEGFRSISSRDKYLRVHNTYEWPDYYHPDHVRDLTLFFDRYLKGLDNGWESTPAVRLAVLDPGHEDTLDRAEATWPVPGFQPTTLYLSRNGSLAEAPSPIETAMSYKIGSNSTQVSFSYQVPQLVESIGYMKVRLWVEARGSDDIELSFVVEKRDADGNVFPLAANNSESTATISATGSLRVSQRALDETLSTPYEPYLTHDREELLTSGEVVPIEVGLRPIALRFHPGEHIVLTISAASIPSTDADMGFGVAIVPGIHIFHMGGRYDSFLLLPLGASNASANATAT
ncbi:hydrolase CocE/NonD family protein [Thozetella sp. PMI_491]|nr:hydrolase CocE/NonD family protein [Thozetella sp. PMI_491]